MNSIKYFFIVLLVLSSCKKDKIEDIPMSDNLKNGLLVLNEGLFQHNNSTLTWIDLSTNTVRNDVFLDKNSRPLGDTGNDIIVYGGKIYIAVTGSSTVEVLDKKTLKSVKQINFNYNNQSQEPRKLAFHNGKVFVSSFDGYVSAIDTVSLQITKRIKVGRNPEGVCVANESLFVANSGGLDFQNPDTTVFEINLNTMSVVDTFVVGENPGSIIADDFNNIYVVKRGDYTSTPSELIRINTVDKSVTNLGLEVTTLSKRGNLLYLSHFNHSTSSSTISIFDCASQTLINPNFINNQDITTLYGVLPFKSDEIICLDAMSFTNTGYLRFFNQSGNLTQSIKVGLNPNSIIHYE
ncbi:YncE family protein [Brumimicrobium glaciale]|uniref:YncE family protein n=1 Tax=Brumimicrobium glaciale TaxID=200475 RepID=A0A4Q4KT02_9FLAO|nr:YncE family protein [Brumimicrobium glaciale]RYM36112.1 YncE family protein [Brumimicrobium glaciale]